MNETLFEGKYRVQTSSELTKWFEKSGCRFYFSFNLFVIAEINWTENNQVHVSKKF